MLIDLFYLTIKWHQMQLPETRWSKPWSGLHTTNQGVQNLQYAPANNASLLVLLRPPGCKEELFTTTPRPRPSLWPSPNMLLASNFSPPLPSFPPSLRRLLILKSEPKGCAAAAGCQVPTRRPPCCLMRTVRSFVPYLSFSDPPFLRTLASCCSISDVHEALGYRCNLHL